MCPKTKDDRDEPMDVGETAARDAAAGYGKRRTITKSGAFPKSEGAASEAPQTDADAAPRSTRVSKNPPVTRGASSKPPSSAREEVTLIGVETSKANRYTFLAPRAGKKKSTPPTT